MSLGSALGSYDTTALTAMASPGLVRRAAKAEIEAIDQSADAAEVRVAGHTVSIDAKGPKAARCSCPATGICLHILAATLALQSAASTSDTSEPAAETPSAAEEIAALATDALVAFAGADWHRAYRLSSGATPELSCTDTGTGTGSVTVLLSDLPAPVTFVPGHGLRGALFKGAESRRRLAVTACALALRAARGVREAEVPDATTECTPLDADLLQQIQKDIAETLPLILNGNAALSADRLMDLAISARVEAAPRLSAALRGLVRHARRAARRDPQFNPEAYLAEAARTAALAHAITSLPADPALTGSLRRDYRPSPPCRILWLGARTWEGESGARGLRLYGWDLDSAGWRIAGPARGPGLDPRFDPARAFRLPFFGGLTPGEVIGNVMTIDAPRVAEGGFLAAAPGQLSAPVALPDALDDWSALLQGVTARSGTGLRRDAFPAAALLRVREAEHCRQDPASGAWTLDAWLRSGHVVPMHLPPGLTSMARDRVRAWIQWGAWIVVEAEARANGPSFHLVSLVRPDTRAVILPGFGIPPEPPEQNLKSLLRSATRRPVRSARQRTEIEVANKALRAAVDMAIGKSPPEGLKSQCSALGLATLARLLSASPGAEAALRLGYVAQETAWSGREQCP